MKITIHRELITDATIGSLSVISDEGEEIFSCKTLEPKIEGLQRNKRLRIPAGKYGLEWHDSPRFKQRLPLLHNIEVSRDRNILIHVGNYLKDTDGCILVGKNYIQREDGAMITKSKDTLKALFEVLNSTDKPLGLVCQIYNDFEKKANSDVEVFV